MPITLAVKTIGQPSGGQQRITVGLTFSGSYPTGGDTLDLTTILGVSYLSRVAVFNNLPVTSDPALGGGFTGEFLPGATLNNGKLKLYTTAGTELAAGTYAANAALLLASLNNFIEFIFDSTE